MAGSSSGPEPEEDRRSTSRYAWDYGLLVACALLTPGQKEQNVLIADVSKDGVALLVAGDPPGSGMNGFLLATNRSSGLTRTLPLTIVHARLLADGRHRVGCRFTNALSFDEMSQLFFRS